MCLTAGATLSVLRLRFSPALWRPHPLAVVNASVGTRHPQTTATKLINDANGAPVCLLYLQDLDGFGMLHPSNWCRWHQGVEALAGGEVVTIMGPVGGGLGLLGKPFVHRIKFQPWHVQT
jgi:hypothetical protein